jgi:Tfp pilus assembly protein PilZ
MKNISGGGICFSNPDQIPEGSMLALEVALPEFPDTVISMGKVCWCRASTDGDDYEIGVEFWWIGWKDEAAQQKLRSFITTALREDLD